MDPARNSTLENGIGRFGNLKLTYFVEILRPKLKILAAENKTRGRPRVLFSASRYENMGVKCIAGDPHLQLAIYGHRWPHMTTCGRIYGHRWPYMATAGHTWLQGAIYGHSWPYMATCGHIRLQLARYGRMWPNMATAGHVWPQLARYGHRWPCIALVGHVWP